MTPTALLRRCPAWAINGVTVTLGLTLVQCSVGLAAGAQAAQVAVAAAVCASLSDVVAPTRRVARRVLVAGIAIIVAGSVFLAIRPYTALILPSVTLIVFASMLLLAWGPKAGTVAFGAALSLVFAMSSPASTTLTWERFGWSVAGVAGYWAWAVASARLLQPVWRRHALADVAAGEGKLLAAVATHLRRPADAIEASGILEQEAALAERIQAAEDLIFGNDKGPEAPLETTILLHLVDLRDLAMASNLQAATLMPQSGTLSQSELKARVVEGMSEALLVLATYLRRGVPPVTDKRAEQAIAEGLEKLEPAGHARAPTTARDPNQLLHSKLALMRRLQRLLEPGAQIELPCRRADLRQYISPDEWRLASVASNLHPSTPVFRHALRTSITAGLAYAIARNLPLTPHPQWIILTIVAVMQGSLAQTLVRRNQRVLGTLVGCIVVALLTLYPSTWFLTACFLVASGVAHAFLGTRYAVTAGAAAVMAVLQSALAAPGSGFSTLERFADTLAGALLGWGATYLLPTWERQALPSVLQRAMTALRAYAAAAIAADGDNAGAPRFARQQAYAALRAANALRSRSLAEPAHVRVPLSLVTGWLGSAYGVMSGLSNLRLTLVLHGRGGDAAAFQTVLAGVARAVDSLLDGHTTGIEAATPSDADIEQALASVPHLASRVRLVLDNASRASLQYTQIQSCFSASRNTGNLLT